MDEDTKKRIHKWIHPNLCSRPGPHRVHVDIGEMGIAGIYDNEDDPRLQLRCFWPLEWKLVIEEAARRRGAAKMR